MQRFDEELHPIAFFSKQMSPAEQKYPVHEQELLAIFLCLKHWRHLLVGSHVTLYTDHRPLTHFKTQPTLSTRQVRWLSFFADYDVDIVAVPGTKNVVADALSRIGFDPNFTGERLEDLRVRFLENVFSDAHAANKPVDDNNPETLYSVYSLPRAYTPDGVPISYNDISRKTPTSTFCCLMDIDRFEAMRDFSRGAESILASFFSLHSSASEESTKEKALSVKNSLIESYKSDAIAQDVINKRPSSANYRMIDEIIYYYDSAGEIRVYIPSSAVCSLGKTVTEFPIEGETVRKQCSLREELIRDLHTSNGHVGKGKTLELIHRYYYWPGMSADVNSYVKGCHPCQQNKSGTHRPYGLLKPTEIPTKRWAFVGMDFIMDLPRTARGNNAIYVVVDMYSKRAHFIPCKTTVTAGQTAQLFYDNVYKHHGMPLKIISDRDVRFTSDIWQSLFSMLNTRLAMSSPYKPSTDGMVERTNRVLEEMLRSFTENRHREWDKFLTAAEFTYNNTVHSSTNHTPFQLDTNMNPLDPHAYLLSSGLLGEVDPSGDSTNYSEAAAHILQDWNDMLSFAQSSLMDAQERYSRYANRFRLDKTYEVGDSVWLDTKHVSIVNANGRFTKRTKFDKRRYGPYKIKRVIKRDDGAPAGAYELDLPKTQKFHPVQPVGRLEPVLQSEVFPHAHSSPPPLPIVSDAGTEFEVDYIKQDRKGKGGRKEYLVKWLGYGDEHDQWCTLAQLRNSVDLITDYESSRSSILSSLVSYADSTKKVFGSCTCNDPLMLGCTCGYFCT
jgi:hypothetical protein